MKGILSRMLILIFFIQGCATYRASRLPSTDVTSFTNYQDQDGLKVVVKFFDARESKKLLELQNFIKNFNPLIL